METKTQVPRPTQAHTQDRSKTRASSSRKATTTGAHGPLLLGLLYRYGALTRQQIVRLTDLHERTVSRQLGYLVESSRVLEDRDASSVQTATGGKPRTVYSLSPTGVQAGARRHGVENDVVASKGYKRVNIKVSLDHRLAANEYLFAVRDAAVSKGYECPADELWSESNPGFPLFGSATARTDRKDTSYRYSRIVPDGVFGFSIKDDLRRYHVEVETAVRTGAVVEKVADYAARWRRLTAPANKGERKFHDPHAKLEPLVILAPSAESAKSLQRSLRERLPETGGFGSAVEAVLAASGRQIDLRQLVVIAGVEEAMADPLGYIYRPLVKLPDNGGGWHVPLLAPGILSRSIRVPPKSDIQPGAAKAKTTTRTRRRADAGEE